MIAFLATLLLAIQIAPDARQFLAEGENAYFILKPGHRLKLEGSEHGARVTLDVTVLDETRVVDGVTTRVVEERESKNGALIEVSRNYLAFDPATRNVYYFGEDVDIYKSGRIVGHEGAWLSGVGGARYGLMMPGDPKVGMKYYQEQAPGVAMDRAEIVSLSDRLTTPSGTFTGCLRAKETTPLEKGAVEYKVYAPGVGLIKDGDLVLISRTPAP